MECQKHFLDGDFSFMDEVDLPDKGKSSADGNKDIVNADSGNNPA